MQITSPRNVEIAGNQRSGWPVDLGQEVTSLKIKEKGMNYGI